MEITRIFWFLEQLENLGGTETATISIANKLVDYYDITFVVTGKEVEPLFYNISSKIKLVFLNNSAVTRIDERILKNIQRKKYFKVLSILIRCINFSLFGKFKFRRLIEKITTNKDVLIASSVENYQIMTKKRHFIFHYHYNAKNFFSINEKMMSLTYHKPDYYVFLSDKIRSEIASKNKKILQNSTFIENMIKLEPSLKSNYYNNNFIFLGRYADQKDPLFLIEVSKILKEKGIQFKFNFYGSGKLKPALIKRVEQYKLNDCVFINDEVKDVKQIFSDKDLLLMSSNYEGMPLVINEANSQSIPVITTDFGESTYDAVPEDCGIIVKNRDPKEYAQVVIDLIQNKERLFDLKKNAYKNSLRYSSETILKKWLYLLADYEKKLK